ncbi:VanW family protein [Paractinoplanes atraurantiacus]|uniref:Vancomycin resistance protein YoaR, contains peptidoglycan-binding and VanW domains n=1 Tax=Paractinoplanes atraurantiacus TaxID=1036182 RepID=A0A285F5P2_9ACTN|nr:VanW family protein [Actinoplanes atraurantiacus]SNY06383.1 Vancomycin resistance protein YoaR, contains peptidoglycan-binding and VanW domains [Actinoplanes atraurantiacus]
MKSSPETPSAVAEPAAEEPDAVPEPAGSRAKVRWLVAGGVVVVLASAMAASGVYAMAGDIPRGTEVLGIDLGGKSRAEAAVLVGAEAATRSTRPVRINVDGREVTLQATAVGLMIDVPATIDAAVGSGPRLFGSRRLPPVVRLDEKKLEGALRKQIPGGRISKKKPGIAFAGVAPVAAYPQAGLDLDRGVAADSVRAAWPVGDVAVVPLVERTPVTTKAQVDELIAGLAKPAVAAPVTVTVGAVKFQLTPAAIAKGLVFRSDADGRLTPAIDAVKLRAAAAREFAKAETPAQQAKISLAGGAPKIVASTPGKVVELGDELLAVLPKPAPRTITATLKDTPASGTDAELARLGIKERVSTFTTYFTGGAKSPRSQNIITIAKAVDGAIVKPGQTFSLNGHTGERGYHNGYKDAPVIVNGVLEPGVAGGASQFTTTLFNAAYYAGLQDVEHKPHSFYFSRYPAVIESTIFYPTLDLKFKNTTPYGILIDTATTGRSVTVSMWGTRIYDSVKTVYGPRRNHTSPPTVHREDGPKCLTSSGLPGFTQDAWRVIRKDGREVERKKFTWRYDPEPRFVCGEEE